MLYRKRGRARRRHEHGVFARFRYNDLKEAARGCGGRFGDILTDLLEPRFRPFDLSPGPELSWLASLDAPCRFGFSSRVFFVVECRGALKGRLRVRAKGQAHRHSCLIETALHRRAACLRTTGFSMEDV